MSQSEAGFPRHTWSLWMDRTRPRTLNPTTKARSSGFNLPWVVALFLLGTRSYKMLCVTAGDEHITIQAYKAEQDDEISLEVGETVEVIHKLLDGWWVVRYDESFTSEPLQYI